ncbi:uncharacterized protein LOC119075478 [Bradysia coprophila]|uniref:uncharacterized protein LOC119075478 n=1 Tax=Bradysia coprophila TaxID=38358 RepID=UPI00187D8D6B|nr:uncharacterized protein LOC119075478 [Bradysia coprophila]
MDRGIVDLPAELILTIFKFLDDRSRLNVSAVCKRWKSLTENCFKWSLHLNRTFNAPACRDLIPTRRQFTNIYLKRDVRVPIILAFFKNRDQAFACTVTDIAITNALFHLLAFSNLLKTFPNLTNLYLSSVTVKLLPSDRWDVQLNDDDKPLCEQLKKLSVCDGTDGRLLQCFTKSKLCTLICRQQRFTRDAVLKFLSTQNCLQEIDFCRIASNTALKFGMGTSVMMPALRNVALDYKSITDFDGIVALLLNQENSFETVELGHIPVLPVLTIVFENLKNLKTLHLMPGSVHDLCNELVLQPLRSVIHLRLYDGANYGMSPTSTEYMTNEIIKNLPNLEDLELFVSYKQSYFQSIVMNLKKLKTLTIRVTFHTNLKDLKFPPVEKLRINCFDYGPNGERIPPISMNAVGEAAEINEAVRSLTYEGVVDGQLFVFIRDTFPKLELLEVRKDLVRGCVSVAGIRCIRYRENSFFAQPMRFDS